MSGWTHLCSLEGSSQSLTLPLMSEQHRECCRKPETRSLRMFSLLCPSSLNYFWTGLVPFGFYFPQPALTNFCGFVLQIKTCSFDCNWNGFPTVNLSFIVQDYEVHKFKLHKFKLHINMNDSFCSDFMLSSGKSSSRNFWQWKDICADRMASTEVLFLFFSPDTNPLGRVVLTLWIILILHRIVAFLTAFFIKKFTVCSAF